VQCPVMIVPSQYRMIDSYVMLYDGEPSSVHAIKMFDYVFARPDWKVQVVSIKEPRQTLHLPDNHLMKEFMKRHFPEAAYAILKGDAEEEIVRYLQNIKQHPLVVLGAYQRGMVSKWFHESMADVLMRELNCPLFIAHIK